jgi:hypothetical protein
VRLALVVGLAACGRIGFDVTTTQGDGNTADAGEPAGLLLHFAFESDGFLHDRGPGHYDATCTTCPTPASARGSTCASFDGTASCLFVAASSLQPAAFTFALWMKPNVTQSNTAFGRAYNGATASTDTMETIIELGDVWSVGTNSLYIGHTLDHGVWHHVAGVYDGSMLTLFLDGTAAAMPQAVGAAMYATDNYTIGCDVNTGSPSEFFDGSIDEVRLYDHPLTPAEVATLAM